MMLSGMVVPAAQARRIPTLGQEALWMTILMYGSGNG